jgi:hypothetical protein
MPRWRTTDRSRDPPRAHRDVSEAVGAWGLAVAIVLLLLDRKHEVFGRGPSSGFGEAPGRGAAQRPRTSAGPPPGLPVPPERAEVRALTAPPEHEHEPRLEVGPFCSARRVAVSPGRVLNLRERVSAPAEPEGVSELEAGAGVHHRSPSRVNSRDDLLRINPL